MIARRERRRVMVERMCHHLKTMQRLSVDQVKSIYDPSSASKKGEIGLRDKRSCCTCRARGPFGRGHPSCLWISELKKVELSGQRVENGGADVSPTAHAASVANDLKQPRSLSPFRVYFHVIQIAI